MADPCLINCQAIVTRIHYMMEWNSMYNKISDHGNRLRGQLTLFSLHEADKGTSVHVIHELNSWSKSLLEMLQKQGIFHESITPICNLSTLHACVYKP